MSMPAPLWCRRSTRGAPESGRTLAPQTACSPIRRGERNAIDSRRLTIWKCPGNIATHPIGRDFPMPAFCGTFGFSQRTRTCAPLVAHRADSVPGPTASSPWLPSRRWYPVCRRQPRRPRGGNPPESGARRRVPAGPGHCDPRRGPAGITSARRASAPPLNRWSSRRVGDGCHVDTGGQARFGRGGDE
jgi:hypothetical protein